MCLAIGHAAGGELVARSRDHADPEARRVAQRRGHHLAARRRPVEFRAAPADRQHLRTVHIVAHRLVDRIGERLRGVAGEIDNDARTRQEGIGADVIVTPPGSSFLSGITGAPVPVKVADILRTQQDDFDSTE